MSASVWPDGIDVEIRRSEHGWRAVCPLCGAEAIGFTDAGCRDAAFEHLNEEHDDRIRWSETIGDEGVPIE